MVMTPDGHLFERTTKSETATTLTNYISKVHEWLAAVRIEQIITNTCGSYMRRMRVERGGGQWSEAFWNPREVHLEGINGIPQKCLHE